jgi:uncharacterized membrane protein YraQ (UPF0718 family)
LKERDAAVIPVFVVTGFLDAGKTTFLNRLLARPDWQAVNLLVLQFESGEAELSRGRHCTRLAFIRQEWERNPDDVRLRIQHTLEAGAFEEIWIEWNGVAPFEQLQALLLHPSLRPWCQLYKVMHIADTDHLEKLLGRTGDALPEHIASSDFALLRGAGTTRARRRIRQVLRMINPGLPISATDDDRALYRQLQREKVPPVSMFFFVALLLAMLYLIARPLLKLVPVPVDTVVAVFLGVILQALPFLVIGVLLASAIQIGVSPNVIERFPKSFGAGMIAAVLGGFCLPVCDCASIPIFRSLVKKGIPLPVAITFMTAAPVINPVVILSTYYAFGGSLRIVAGRIGLGMIAAVLIGASFAFWPPKGSVLSGGDAVVDGISCGCYESRETAVTWAQKASLFLRHSQVEFFSVGKYLLMGTGISAVFQTMGTGAFAAAEGGASLLGAILIMMALAFVLSLCSSSDAVVARSFASQFPSGALMGFLVFGPMMDIKNVMMLSAGFSRRFIARLLLTATAVCSTTVFLAYTIGGM